MDRDGWKGRASYIEIKNMSNERYIRITLNFNDGIPPSPTHLESLKRFIAQLTSAAEIVAAGKSLIIDDDDDDDNNNNNNNVL
jgi:hypothetical protein